MAKKTTGFWSFRFEAPLRSIRVSSNKKQQVSSIVQLECCFEVLLRLPQIARRPWRLAMQRNTRPNPFQTQGDDDRNRFTSRCNEPLALI